MMLIKRVIYMLIAFTCALCSGCKSGRSAFKDYCDLLAQKKPLQAEKYISQSCRDKLIKASSVTDMSRIIQATLPENLTSYEIGKAQTIGDTVFVAVKLTLADGLVLNLDKDQAVRFTDGSSRVFDYRYRLNKEGNQWKVNVPYCRNHR